jgi:hypothetical protein
VKEVTEQLKSMEKQKSYTEKSREEPTALTPVGRGSQSHNHKVNQADLVTVLATG